MTKSTTETVAPGVYRVTRQGHKRHYIVQWREDGQRKSTTVDLRPNRDGRKFRTAEQAISFREWATDPKRQEAVIDLRAQGQPFGEYVEEWFDRKARAGLQGGRMRKSTVVQQRHLLRHITTGRLTNIAISRLTASHVEDFMADLHDKGLSASTVRQTMVLVRAALDRAFQDELVRRNVAARLTMPVSEKVAPERRTISEAEVERLAGLMGDYGDLIRLVARTGLRLGEAVALTADDITVDGMALDAAIRERGVDLLGAGELHVAKTLSELGGTIRNPDGSLRFGDPKTNSSARVLPIPASVVRMLAGHVAKFGLGEEDLIFTNTVGRGIQGSTFRRPWRKAVAELGLPAFKFHGLRHQTRTWLQAERYGLEVVAVILGHAESSVTHGYGQVPAEVVAEALARLADRLDRAAEVDMPGDMPAAS